MRCIVLLSLLLPVTAVSKEAYWCDPAAVTCRVLPNGDVEFHSPTAHCVYVVAKKDAGNPKAKPIKSTCPWDKK